MVGLLIDGVVVLALVDVSMATASGAGFVGLGQSCSTGGGR